MVYKNLGVNILEYFNAFQWEKTEITVIGKLLLLMKILYSEWLSSLAPHFTTELVMPLGKTDSRSLAYLLAVDI